MTAPSKRALFISCVYVCRNVMLIPVAVVAEKRVKSRGEYFDVVLYVVGNDSYVVYIYSRLVEFRYPKTVKSEKEAFKLFNKIAREVSKEEPSDIYVRFFKQVLDTYPHLN